MIVRKIAAIVVEKRNRLSEPPDSFIIPWLFQNTIQSHCLKLLSVMQHFRGAIRISYPVSPPLYGSGFSARFSIWFSARFSTGFLSAYSTGFLRYRFMLDNSCFCAFSKTGCSIGFLKNTFLPAFVVNHPRSRRFGCNKRCSNLKNRTTARPLNGRMIKLEPLRWHLRPRNQVVLPKKLNDRKYSRLLKASFGQFPFSNKSDLPPLPKELLTKSETVLQRNSFK